MIYVKPKGRVFQVLIGGVDVSREVRLVRLVRLPRRVRIHRGLAHPAVVSAAAGCVVDWWSCTPDARKMSQMPGPQPSTTAHCVVIEIEPDPSNADPCKMFFDAAK